MLKRFNTKEGKTIGPIFIISKKNIDKNFWNIKTNVIKKTNVTKKNDIFNNVVILNHHVRLILDIL